MCKVYIVTPLRLRLKLITAHYVSQSYKKEALFCTSDVVFSRQYAEQWRSLV